MQIMIDSWIFNFPIKIASSFTERIFYTLAIYIQEIFKLIVVSVSCFFYSHVYIIKLYFIYETNTKGSNNLTR